MMRLARIVVFLALAVAGHAYAAPLTPASNAAPAPTPPPVAAPAEKSTGAPSAKLERKPKVGRYSNSERQRPGQRQLSQPPIAKSQVPQQDMRISPACQSPRLRVCVEDRSKKIAACGPDCAPKLREALGGLKPLIVNAVKAQTSAPLGTADWKLLQLAYRCLGDQGQAPDDGACNLFIIERDDQAHLAEITNRLFKSAPIAVPPPSRDPIALTLQITTLALIGILTALVFRLLDLATRRPRRRPAEDERSAPEALEGAPEDGINHSGAISQCHEPPGELVAAAKAVRTAACEPELPFHVGAPVLGSSEVAEAQRQVGSDFAEAIAVKDACWGRMKARRLSAPEMVIELFSLIRVLHSKLDYAKMPPEDFQNRLSSAISKVHPDYQLYWDTDQALLSDAWYEMVNDRGRGDGSPWLERVESPGLKRGDEPVIPAKIQVRYGPKPA